MSFYQNFKFKATGIALTGVADFTAAAAGTEFEKNSGEVFVKLASGEFDKIARIYSAHKDNLSSTRDPIATDDSTQGYVVGSVWVNTVGKTAFRCVDATATAAVWTAGGGAGLVSIYTASGDGVKTIYTPADFAEPGFYYKPGNKALSIHVDGVYQQAGSFSETSTTSITFSQAIPAGSLVEVKTVTSQVSGGDKITEYQFTGDGAQTAFTVVDMNLAGFAYTPGNKELIIDIGGVMQNTTDYTETNASTVTFIVAPPLGVTGIIKVIGSLLLADAIPVGDKSYLGNVWIETSINITAIPGDRIFVDTTNNPVTITLPPGGSLGESVKIVDSVGTFDSNACILARNGRNIMGLAQDMTVNTLNAKIEVVSKSTDWRIV